MGGEESSMVSQGVISPSPRVRPDLSKHLIARSKCAKDEGRL